MKGFFNLRGHETTAAKELSAGIAGFLTVIYIIAVNGMILSEAGMPAPVAVAATIMAASAGCFIMAFWANAPIIVVPGMGINAMFTYVFVHEMNMTWQQALGVTIIAGILFAAIALTPLAGRLNSMIPASLKEAITAGLGLFLIVIGASKLDFSVPHALTLLVAFLLLWRKVPGAFVWVIASGTLIASLFGTMPGAQTAAGTIQSGIAEATVSGLPAAVWIPAVFSLTMVLLFENIGIISGQLQMAGHPEKFRRAVQASAGAVIASGLAGSSANVPAVESAAPIASGGRTGIVPLVAGLLFPAAFLAAPYIGMLPGSAVAPILIWIGALMAANVRRFGTKDWTELVPALAIVVIIPLTSSIADGIAAGFVLYPLLKLTRGRIQEVPVPLLIIAALFLMNTMIS